MQLALGLSLVDAKTGKEAQRVAHGLEYPRPLGFSHDSRKLFFVGPGNAISIVDLATGKTLHELKGHERPALSSVISPDGQWFVSMGWTDMSKKDVILWETATGRLIRRLPQHHSAMTSSVVFSPDGRDVTVAEFKFDPRSRDSGGDVSVIDIQTGKVKKSFSTAQVASLAYSPDGQSLAVGETNGTLRLWEIATGQPRHRFVGHRDYVHSLAFDHDGSVLAASSRDAPAYVWDVYGKFVNMPSADEKKIAISLDRAWSDLADKDAMRAFEAIRRLVQNPSPAVTLLKAQLVPAQAIEIKSLTKSLNDLNSDDFEIRQKALAELEKLSDRVETHLEKALDRNPTLETRRRLEGLIAMSGPNKLRHTRAVEALEQIASPAAAQFLTTLAAGEPGAPLTRAAVASLDRIRKR